ncbi:magnesium/cobalt transporter CorA [Synechococcus sp. CS-603]|uniref:magnesium/cobalt transporter CorA n=1 Tax=Synechococcus sp. CS-603 TaxID=2847981 RepID=UPI00223AD1FA|nr:magnesium/cobalt transporter CorA [Synechococcus sp. CS-603]MCT0201815.1 magnesium/cobalt transporter CorA [Synechococcus sp. CS-603]
MIRTPPDSLISRRLEERPGHLPGQLFVHGGAAPTRLSVLRFEPGGMVQIQLERPDQLALLIASGDPLWVRLQGLADPSLIRQIFRQLGVPALLHAPLIDTPQRTRVDAAGDAVLVVIHRLGFAKTPAQLISEQVGLLLLPNLLISLEEVPKQESFPQLTRWLANLTPPPSREDLDDVLHFLIDEMLDELFPILEQFSDLLDRLEEMALRDPKPKLLARSYQARVSLRRIHHQVWPLRHQILILLRQNQRLLGPEARRGFEDMEQHVRLIFENTELLRHQCDAVSDAYIASTGNRMNQVMKTLTIVSSIFAPLTFIAGIYGMNFKVMPELDLPFGYYLALALMALIAMLQTYLLWRRGWFVDWTATRR